MRVGVDATGWANPRGFGRFTRNAVAALAARGDLVLELVVDADEQRRRCRRGCSCTGSRSAGRPFGRRPPTRGAIRDVLRTSAAARSSPFDVVLFPSLHTWFPVRGIPAVVGVHDAIAKRHPELTCSRAPDASRGPRRSASRSARPRALHRLAGGPHGRRLRVRPRPCRDRRRPRGAGPVVRARGGDVAAAALAPLGLAPGRFVLCAPGGISPHKGVETLLRLRDAARAAARPTAGRRRRAHGRGVPLGGRRLVPAVGQLGLEEDVVLTGFVPDDDARRPVRGRAAASSTRRSRRGVRAPRGRGGRVRRCCRAQRHPRSPGDARRGRALLPAAGRGALADRLEALLGGRRRSRADVGARCRAAVQGLRGRRLPTRSPTCSRGRRRVASPLSFCMVTTFYPPHHFGGDAIQTYRLTNELARRGHRGHGRSQRGRVPGARGPSGPIGRSLTSLA